jgi:hypothetical protein
LEGVWCVCVIVTRLFVVVEEGGEYGLVGGKCESGCDSCFTWHTRIE